MKMSIHWACVVVLVGVVSCDQSDLEQRVIQLEKSNLELLSKLEQLSKLSQVSSFWVKKTSPTATSGYEMITWDTIVTNIGGDFANNEYTAPVNGVYMFHLNCNCRLPDCRFMIYKNGAEVAAMYGSSGGSSVTYSHSDLLDLNAGDKISAYFNYEVYGTDLWGYTTFSGYLLSQE